MSSKLCRVSKSWKDKLLARSSLEVNSMHLTNTPRQRRCLESVWWACASRFIYISREKFNKLFRLQLAAKNLSCHAANIQSSIKPREWRLKPRWRTSWHNGCGCVWLNEPSAARQLHVYQHRTASCPVTHTCASEAVAWLSSCVCINTPSNALRWIQSLSSFIILRQLFPFHYQHTERGFSSAVGIDQELSWRGEGRAFVWITYHTRLLPLPTI